MKQALPLTFLAGPALAHEGAHAHPHGIDALWLVVVGALALASVYFMGRGRK